MVGEPHLSLVAPAHDEEECIEEFLVEVHGVLGALGVSFEIICIDDGSTDQTLKALDRMKPRIPELRVLALENRQGQSAALAAGVQAARGTVIALIDSDLQNDPADLERLLQVLEDQPLVQAVVGRRRVRIDPWIRRWSSVIANRMAAWMVEEPGCDAGCGLKVFRSALLKGIRPFRGMHRFLVPLARLEGALVVEVDVNHRPRRLGRSKYGSGLSRASAALCDALGVRWMQSRRLLQRWKEH
jgi:dolichol-phosphate mannosyltransferase